MRVNSAWCEETSAMDEMENPPNLDAVPSAAPDLKIADRPGLLPSYWNCPTPEPADTAASYATYTDLEPYRPDSYPGYSVFTSEASYGQLPPLPINVLADENNPGYDTSFIKLEYASSHDEGIGSNTSSSCSPPIIPAEPQNPEHAVYFPQIDASSTRDSGIGCADLALHPDLRRPECLQCGASCSQFFWQKGNGHFLCDHCFASRAISPLPVQHEGMDETSDPKRRKKLSTKIVDRLCHNCLTGNTPLWRRNSRQEFLCNACALYEKLHKKKRPASMNKGKIQRRNRKPRNDCQKNGAPNQVKKEIVSVPEVKHQPMTFTSFASPMQMNSPSSLVSSYQPIQPSPLYPTYTESQEPARRGQPTKVILPPMSMATGLFNSAPDSMHHQQFGYLSEMTATCGR